MKRTIAWILLLVLVMAMMTGATGSGQQQSVEMLENWSNPYTDVSEDDWSYEAIRALNFREILPSADTFDGNRQETRGNVVFYLYQLYRSLGGPAAGTGVCAFTDVRASDERYSAICWAAENGIINGVSETEFAPDASITRQQVCAMVMRYAAFAGARLAAVKPADQFVDSLNVSVYARSYVTACQMSGLVSGYPDNYFRPENNISRNESAVILYRLLNAQLEPPDASAELVKTGVDDYNALYETYEPEPFEPLVPESTAVADSWFDRTVFIGDSVTQGLALYCGSSLSKAQFLSAGSMSAENALTGVIKPTFQGEKVSLPEGVARSGAQVVYVMLGMNGISYGVDTAAADLEKLLLQITDRNPDVTILVESVTPMTRTSTIVTQRLNNEKIREYNEKVLELCLAHEWYYVNVAEALADSEGYLLKEYCSDASVMGIHMTVSGVNAWTDYLKTHVPEDLK